MLVPLSIMPKVIQPIKGISDSFVILSRDFINLKDLERFISFVNLPGFNMELGDKVIFSGTLEEVEVLAKAIQHLPERSLSLNTQNHMISVRRAEYSNAVMIEAYFDDSVIVRVDLPETARKVRYSGDIPFPSINFSFYGTKYNISLSRGRHAASK